MSQSFGNSSAVQGCRADPPGGGHRSQPLLVSRPVAGGLAPIIFIWFIAVAHLPSGFSDPPGLPPKLTHMGTPWKIYYFLVSGYLFV